MGGGFGYLGVCTLRGQRGSRLEQSPRGEVVLEGQRKGASMRWQDGEADEAWRWGKVE